MFLLAVLCLVASTAAMPALDYPTPPEALILVIPEMELHTNLPNIETGHERKIDSEAVHPQPSVDGSNEEEEEERRILVLPALPSPPELPLFDKTILEYLLKKDKSEDVQDESEDVKPHTIKWKLPKIRFPGGSIINDVYMPHISMSV